MNSKFTPGPWFVVPQGRFVADKKVEFDSDGARVGETPNMCIECASEADANLIAAAPEMWCALIRCICELERASSMGINIVPGVIEYAYGVLRKARGGA
jgi:hypothetical protein